MVAGGEAPKGQIFERKCFNYDRQKQKDKMAEGWRFGSGVTYDADHADRLWRREHQQYQEKQLQFFTVIQP